MSLQEYKKDVKTDIKNLSTYCAPYIATEVCQWLGRNELILGLDSYDLFIKYFVASPESIRKLLVIAYLLNERKLNELLVGSKYFLYLSIKDERIILSVLTASKRIEMAAENLSPLKFKPIPDNEGIIEQMLDRASFLFKQINLDDVR